MAGAVGWRRMSGRIVRNELRGFERRSLTKLRAVVSAGVAGFGEGRGAERAEASMDGIVARYPAPAPLCVPEALFAPAHVDLELDRTNADGASMRSRELEGLSRRILDATLRRDRWRFVSGGLLPTGGLRIPRRSPNSRR